MTAPLTCPCCGQPVQDGTLQRISVEAALATLRRAAATNYLPQIHGEIARLDLALRLHRPATTQAKP